MKKTIFITLAAILLTLTACEPEVLHVRKTYIDRTLYVEGVLDPIINTPWLQNKYLAFQEDSAHVKSRALMIFTETGTTMPHIFEYSKILVAGEFEYNAHLYNCDGSDYSVDGQSSSSLSLNTAALIDSLVYFKIYMVTFPPDDDDDVAKISPMPLFEGIDTILNSAKIEMLSCSLLEDAPTIEE